MSQINESVFRKIENLVTHEGYELVHLEFKRGGGRNYLRVYIDRPGGISLDDCQNISRQVSTLLDVEDPIPFPYVLEVSSPGLDRGLYKESDYVRFVGRRVRLSLRLPEGGRRNYRGRIVAAGGGVVRVAEPAQGEWTFSIESIDKAHLEIEI